MHRVAASARRHLVGKRFTATSPNGRFAHGAEVIDAKELKRVEAIGKNLFYFFNESDGPEAHVMHVHFGMSGRFATHHALPGPDPTATTRLRLESKEHGICALLSAMTVDIGDCTLFQTKRAKLGEDPLREDADADRLWEKFTKSRKSVGLALMDQAMFAGVGNIYRAEILYKSGVHPEQPCTDLSRSDFDEVWRHSVELLQRGFVTGSILTVDPEEAKVLGEPWTRRYVYNQRSCGRCGDAVKTWDMANRTVYCCEGCQPLLPSTRGVSERASVRTKDAKAHVPFVSHCAAESPGTLAAEPEKLTVAKLKEISGLGVRVAPGASADGEEGGARRGGPRHGHGRVHAHDPRAARPRGRDTEPGQAQAQAGGPGAGGCRGVRVFRRRREAQSRGEGKRGARRARGRRIDRAGQGETRGGGCAGHAGDDEADSRRAQASVALILCAHSRFIHVPSYDVRRETQT